ncbi:hypothetical protein FQR65_LT11648 [Abscondita terminalis]|nr:hypothetical protein FQR65_LT11648 [Abscondita terminalis]
MAAVSAMLLGRKLFSVVEFTKDNSVEAVPAAWIHENNVCSWPNKLPVRFRTLQEDANSTPDSSWPLFEINIIKTYDTFEKVNKKAKRFVRAGKLDTTDTDAPKTSRERRSPIKHGINHLIEPTTLLHTEPLTIIDCENVPIVENYSFINDITQAVTPVTEAKEGYQPLSTQADVNLLPFQHVVVTQLTELKHEFSEIKQLLLKTIASQGSVLAPNTAKSLGLLPVKSQDDFTNLNAVLETQDEYNLLVGFLSRIGGETITKCTYNVLSTLFKVSAATEIGLTSNTGKTSLKSSRVGHAIRVPLGEVNPNIINPKHGKQLHHSSDKENSDVILTEMTQRKSTRTTTNHFRCFSNDADAQQLHRSNVENNSDKIMIKNSNGKVSVLKRNANPISIVSTTVVVSCCIPNLPRGEFVTIRGVRNIPVSQRGDRGVDQVSGLEIRKVFWAPSSNA